MFSTKSLLPLRASAVLLGTTAFADVTGADVWADIQTSMTAYGEDQITIGSETTDGDTLTVSDIQVSIVDDAADIVVSSSLPFISFTDQSDGSVLVTMADSMQITAGDPSSDSGFDMTVANSGLEVSVSGTPEELTYTINAALYSLTVDAMRDFGEDIPLDMTFVLNDVSGNYVVRPGEIRETVYDLTTARVDMLFALQDDATDMSFSGQISDLAVQGRAAGPEDIFAGDPEDFDMSGIDIAGGYTFGALSYIFDIDDRGDGFAGAIAADGGSLDVVFNAGELAYATVVQNMTADITTTDFPLPISVQMAEYGLNFAMPLAPTEAPAPMAIGINLTELSVNEDLWMLADPAEQLPHDPITAQIGISGTIKMLFDLLDPDQQMAMAMAPMPAEPHSVQIDQLNIDALGLQVTGEGGFTFDNSDMQTIPGVPRPEGSVTVDVTGLNALLDTLVSMGFIPENDVMGARMMMGMFATATGDDALRTSVEINDQGHVFVNGQRML